jgi:hypothetical protein
MDQTVCEIFEAPKLSLNPALFLQPWVIFYLVVDSKLVFQVKMQQFEQKKILTHIGIPGGQHWGAVFWVIILVRLEANGLQIWIWRVQNMG